jgi:hypothetical protein
MNIEKKDLSCDYYEATLEKDSLVMVPHCACGNTLNDDYICEKCKRHCHCRNIICDNEATLSLVKTYIRKSPQFSRFTVKLTDSK